MVHGISGNGGNQPINFNTAGKTNKAVKSNEVKSFQPIDMIKTTDSVDRKDLDKLGLYASMGVNISPKAPAGSVESYMAAAPEFNSWTGNFTISKKGKEEALTTLGAYAKASADFKQVEQNLMKNDFLDTFNTFDTIMSLA